MKASMALIITTWFNSRSRQCACEHAKKDLPAQENSICPCGEQHETGQERRLVATPSGLFHSLIKSFGNSCFLTGDFCSLESESELWEPHFN